MNTKHLKATGIWLAVLALGLAGCGIKEAFDDTQRTDAAIKAELGFDSSTSWERTNGHPLVHVRLASPPPGDAAVTKREITAVVMKTFRSPVESVDVQY